MPRPALTALLLTIAACHHASPTSPTAPNYAPVATEAAPPHAAHYAACLADATARDDLRRAHDPTTELLLFRCEGAPARAFYDALADWSAHLGSQFEHGDRTVRSTSKVQRDLFGVDYCAVDATDAVECVITLNVGPFLTQ